MGVSSDKPPRLPKYTRSIPDPLLREALRRLESIAAYVNAADTIADPALFCKDIARMASN